MHARNQKQRASLSKTKKFPKKMEKEEENNENDVLYVNTGKMFFKLHYCKRFIAFMYSK